MLSARRLALAVLVSAAFLQGSETLEIDAAAMVDRLVAASTSPLGGAPGTLLAEP